ncbi:MAG: type II toxin-antitoxin system VapC family toxin [Phycisphaerae bacterium]|nr:type II toxin-antitoxin system VapC family toxin [Phycisphaerae bacterium]
MADYLLDTNIWSFWFNGEKYAEYAANIQAHIQAITGDPKHTGSAHVLASIITWGEIEYGYTAMKLKERSREAQFRAFVAGQSPLPLLIDKHTAVQYGQLRARLFEKYGPKEMKGKGLRPEQLIDPVSSLHLQIQENDLWMAAQALRYGMILVSDDKMRAIKAVAGQSLQVQNWTVPLKV